LDSSENIFEFDPAAPPPAPPPPLPVVEPAGENPIFNLLDVFLIWVIAVVALIFCSSVAFVIYSTRHGHIGQKELLNNVLVFLPAQVAAYILIVGFMVLLIRQKYHTKFLEAVKWNMPGTRLAWGSVAIGALLAVGTQTVAGLLSRWIPKSLPISQLFSTPAAAWALASFGILVAPLVEELFFRGFLFPALARQIGSVFATIITALGFALIHGDQLALAWIPLALLFIVGTVLTVARARTQSVAVSVLMHVGYNTTLFTLLYITTRGFHHMELG
jgi:membrane protease YdiL (CAAX protease family)